MDAFLKTPCILSVAFPIFFLQFAVSPYSLYLAFQLNRFDFNKFVRGLLRFLLTSYLIEPIVKIVPEICQTNL